MEEIKKLFEYLINLISKLSPIADQNAIILCHKILSNINEDRQKNMRESIRNYIRSSYMDGRIDECNLDPISKAKFEKIFGLAAHAYIAAPEQPSQPNFTTVLQDSMYLHFNAEERASLISALDFNALEAYIRHKSLTNAEVFQDTLVLLHNAIWVADRLVQAHSAADFEYPYIAEMKNFIQLLHNDGFTDSEITLDMLNSVIPREDSQQEAMTISDAQRNEILSNLISALNESDQGVKRTKLTASLNGALLEKLKSLRSSNKQLDNYTFTDLMALDNALRLNINEDLKEQLRAMQDYVTERFRDNIGFNQVKAILLIMPKGHSSWDKSVAAPKLLAEALPMELFFITLLLGSKASEDKSIPTAYLAATFGKHRNPGERDYEEYKVLRSHVNALEKYIVTVLNNDLSLDPNKLSTQTRDFFATMSGQELHTRFRV